MKNGLMARFRHGRLLLLPLLLTTAVRGQTVLPLTEREGLLSVTVSVNDRPHMFLFDSGARTSIVTPEASALSRKELAKLRKIQLYGAGGTGSEAHLGTLKLTIGSRGFVGEFVIAKMTSLRFAKKFDGILGNDLLTQFRRVVIDYKAHTLTLWEQ